MLYLVGGGQLLAVGGEGDEAGGQVNVTANLQVRVGAGGGVGGADDVSTTHHVTVTPPHTGTEQTRRGKRVDEAMRDWRGSFRGGVHMKMVLVHCALLRSNGRQMCCVCFVVAYKQKQQKGYLCDLKKQKSNGT